MPTGAIVESASQSTPPVSGAKRVDCSMTRQSAQPLPTLTPPPRSGAVPVADECGPYYGRGYCTDYIKQRVGSRPSGDPKSWPLKPISMVKEGAAVVFGSVTTAGHVAYVERVISNAAGAPIRLEVSEMNYAKGTKSGTPKSCLVTNAFGVVSRRTVAIDRSITGVWVPQ